MAILIMVAKWALTPIGSLVSVLIVMFGAWQVSGLRGEQRGAARAVAKIEKATENAATIGKRAADKSVSGGVRGQRDPTTRND